MESGREGQQETKQITGGNKDRAKRTSRRAETRAKQAGGEEDEGKDHIDDLQPSREV